MWKWRRSPSGCLDEKLKLWAPMQVVFIDFDVQTKLCSDTHGERERVNMRKIHRENCPTANDLWFRLFKTTQIVCYTHTAHHRRLTWEYSINKFLEPLKRKESLKQHNRDRKWATACTTAPAHNIYVHTEHIFEWVRFIGFWWFSVFPLLA